MRIKLSLLLIVIYALHWTNGDENGSTDFHPQLTKTSWSKLVAKLDPKRNSIDMSKVLGKGSKAVMGNTDSDSSSPSEGSSTTVNTTITSPSTITSVDGAGGSSSTISTSNSPEGSSATVDTTITSPSTITSVDGAGGSSSTISTSNSPEGSSATVDTTITSPSTITSVDGAGGSSSTISTSNSPEGSSATVDTTITSPSTITSVDGAGGSSSTISTSNSPEGSSATVDTTITSPSTITSVDGAGGSSSTISTSNSPEGSSTTVDTTTTSPSTTRNVDGAGGISSTISTSNSPEGSSTTVYTTNSYSPTSLVSHPTAASSPSSTSFPSQTERQIVNGNYTLNSSSPLTIQFNVSGHESLQFKIDVLSDNNTAGVTVKAAMCGGNQSNAWNISSSNVGVYEISADMISNMTQEFCADKLRLKDINTEANIFSLYIFGDNFTEDETIHVEGTAIESTSTESNLTNTTTTLSTTATPASSKGLELGWIVSIVLGCLLVIAIATAIGIFLYYCQKNRKVFHEEQKAIWRRASVDDKSPYRSAFTAPMNVYDTSMAGRLVNSKQIYNQRASNFSGAAYDFAPIASQSQPMRLPTLSKQPDFPPPPARNLGNRYSSLTAAQGQLQLTNDLYGYSAGTDGRLFPRLPMQTKADRYADLRI